MLFDDEKNHIENNIENNKIYDSIAKVLHKISSIYTKIANGETISASEAALLNQVPNLERFVNIYIRILKESDSTTELHSDLQQLINLIKDKK